MQLMMLCYFASHSRSFELKLVWPISDPGAHTLTADSVSLYDRKTVVVTGRIFRRLYEVIIVVNAHYRKASRVLKHRGLLSNRTVSKP